MASLWAWERGLFGKKTAPNPVEVPGFSNTTKIASSHGVLIALTREGEVLEWAPGQAAFPDKLPAPTLVAGLEGIVDVISSDGTQFAIRSDGTLWAWGKNSWGELGDGTREPREQPVQVLNLTSVVSVTSEKWASFAVQADGSVWGWGRDMNGALGLGRNPTHDHTGVVPAPMKLPDLTNVRSVSTALPSDSNKTGYALRSDGSVWAWGDGRDGQVGDGTSDGNWIPRPVSVVFDAIALATASTIFQDSHVTAFALRSDGSVWAWGANEGGQLGDGTTNSRAIPHMVPGLTDVIAISPNWAAAYALKSDGTVWFWGSNMYTTSETPTYHWRPVQMAGLPRISYLAAHLSEAYAIGIDGSLWCWDHDWSTPPRQINDIANASMVVDSGFPFCAVLTDTSASETAHRALAHTQTNQVHNGTLGDHPYAGGPTGYVRASEAADPSTPMEVLEDLSTDPDPEVRASVAKNSSTSTAVLEDLSTDPDPEVRASVAKNPWTPPEVLEDLSTDPDPEVRASVAKNPSTPADESGVRHHQR